MKTTIKASTVKINRTRVKELAVVRLEALTEKQRIRRPKGRPHLPTVSAATQARNTRHAENDARIAAQQNNQPLSTQIRTQALFLCYLVLINKRRSLTPAHEAAFIYQMAGIYRMTVGEELSPRVRETGPAIRCLGRAEALLTRLVWRGAEAQARKEAQQQAETKEADVLHS